MENKTHYRKVFKSDHLSSADLEDLTEQKKDLNFTIQSVKQHVLDPNVSNSGVRVAGKVIGANIAHIVEDIKPLVLNATNSKQVANIVGSNFVQDWKNVKITLYIDQNVKFKGSSVQGIRIKSGFKLTKEILKTLFNNKKSKVADSQLASIERIIIEDEIASFSKVFNYLNKL
jgi:hypothetical protein